MKQKAAGGRRRSVGAAIPHHCQPDLAGLADLGMSIFCHPLSFGFVPQVNAAVELAMTKQPHPHATPSVAP
jgi:hypothetical protein